VSVEVLQFLASSPRGLADLLARELTAFGAEGVKERSTGVVFSGGLRVAYRACLESRVANRVYLELGRFEVRDAQDFYTLVRGIDWPAHLGPGATLACDFSGHHPTITHTHFGALKLKDAIVDSIRDATGSRPDVALERPSVRVHAHANGSNITVSLDLSGESLHRRGYRGAAGEAPLKENVAAGILMRAGWPEMVRGTGIGTGAQTSVHTGAGVGSETGSGTRMGVHTGAQFLDPMCGSGTFVIEAALIAVQQAPGLDRDYHGFLGWKGHDVALWEEVVREARARSEMGRTQWGLAPLRALAASAHGGIAWSQGGEMAAPQNEIAPARTLIIRGQDRDGTAIRNARANATRAGIGELVQFEVKELADAAPAEPTATALGAGDVGAPSADLVGRESSAEPEVAADGETAVNRVDAGDVGTAPSVAGLLCVNPPYGVRMEDREGALAVHRQLGVVLRERFQGWAAAVLIGSPELGMELGIRAYRTHTVWNGALECRLLRLKIDAQSEREPGRFSKPDASLRESPGARMFANRLAKNFKRLQSWAERSEVFCYRVYDADMPEYAFAIDLYRTLEPDLTWLYVQEYAAPAEIELDAVRRRRNEALSVLPEVTGVPTERIHVRTRRRNKRGEQYRKVDEQASYHVVMEGGLKFWVNFDDYLDTGLFLDHRMTRARLGAAASGKRFLNLFAYTGTATVYAVVGGAASSTSVDLSRTYLEWAQRNLALNGITGRQHTFIQADCREWLEESVPGRERYDLIFLDPPTFSNSKRMEGVLDVERDHPALIDACVRLLAPDGLIVFSTNAQRFKLHEEVAARYGVRDISAATLPKDFERNPRIHRCFEIRGSAAISGKSLYRASKLR
jgi:23S rRNA (guanine2445-N2)-methyltransferase / 23S rRNA (guanine2069-N7)-methyltransferase